MRITDYLSEKTIKIGMEAWDKESAIHELCYLIAPGDEELPEMLYERELVRSTGYGKGVAIPRSCKAKISGMALGISRPIDWHSADNVYVNIVFVFVSPIKMFLEHIETLKEIAKILANDGNRAMLMNSKTPQEVIHILSQAELTARESAI